MKRVISKVGLAVVLLFALSSSASAQQDVQFSEYVFNQLALNPAYAGYRGETYLNAMYRSQWVSMPGAPQTLSATFEFLQPKTEDRVAWSLKLTNDQLGPQKNTSAFVGYTYRIPLNEEDTKRLCFGISAGINQYSLDGTAFKYVDNNDQMIPAGAQNRTAPDANFGVFYYTPKWYISAGATNLMSGNILNSTYYYWEGYDFQGTIQSLHTFVEAGTLFNLSDEVKLRPSLMWKDDFKGPTNIDLTAFLVLHDIFWIGGSYRTGVLEGVKNNLQNALQSTDAASIMVAFYPFPNFRISYAYDITTSKLNPYQNGSHEISLGIGFPHKDKRELSPRYF